MAIIKNKNAWNFGYSKGFQMLTNFTFEILSVEYRDNLYGYFTIKITNDNLTFLEIDNISVCGPNSQNFQSRLLENSNYICNPIITDENLLEIFSYEFDQYKTNTQIKELQQQQLVYGNQSAALESSDNISFEDKKTLRSHYSTKQTELQKRIDKLNREFSVVSPETIVKQTGDTD